MVAQDSLVGCLSATELEFLAENELITIKPHTDIPRLTLISVSSPSP
jgi:hypothetical protein